MKNLFKTTILSSALLLGATAQAQTLGNYIDQGKKLLNNNSNSKTSTRPGATNNNNSGTTGNFASNLSNTDVVSALREALQIGAQNSGSKLSSLNGYFGNQLIKILMPAEAKKVESTLRSIGMGQQVDKVIMSMNRAAEDAAMKSVPIFVDAIKTFSIQDGLAILKGGSGAATNYLKGKTTSALTNAFRPVISNSLDKVNATKYWREIFTIYNQLPTVTNKINPDLTGYVTERALNGLFVTIADEENKIRTNPAARVTDLLKKVFSAK